MKITIMGRKCSPRESFKEHAEKKLAKVKIKEEKRMEVLRQKKLKKELKTAENESAEVPESTDNTEKKEDISESSEVETNG